ncbi:MAG TPA: TonB-dependent receptor [Bacteroidia bacterium]|nr:TonB-dependent receptor [Bacteroidia bacterium]
MRHSLYILLAFVITGGSLFAQFPGIGSGAGPQRIFEGKITGTVLDSLTKKPVEFASVGLYEQGSEKPIDGVLTDGQGDFKLKNLRNGIYHLSITFVGYGTKNIDSLRISEKKSALNISKVHLAPSVNLLKETTIEAEKSLIETKIDKLVYNAEKDITSKGGNATDVLRKVPMVQVDLDGNVMLQGTQNVKVLINNKPSSLTAGSVADAMKMIPADEIEKVEVITSPSAKYDAEGTGGIINIITKKKNIHGFSGMVNAGAGTRSSNLFGNVSYRTGRLGTGLNFGGFGYTGKGDLLATRTTPYSSLRQEGDNKNTGFGPYGQLTLDYDFTSRFNVNGSLRVNDFANTSKGITDNYFSFNGNSYQKLFSSDYDTKTEGLNYDASLDLKQSFKKPDQELTLSGQLTNSNRNTEYEVIRMIDSLPMFPYKENSLNKSGNREFTLQLDYTHPLTKELTLEAGGKNILRKVKSDYNYKIYSYVADAFLTDDARSNVFDYNQHIYAGYMQLSATVKRWGFKSGLRYEHTKLDSDFDQTSSKVSNEYENYIPTATVSYTRPTKYTLKFSYTQRIQRPGLTYLNPYVNQSDIKNISYGNPGLSAEKSQSFEFGWNSFRKFGSITTSIYHRFTNNAIEGIRFVDTNDVYVSTYDNIGKNYSTGASIGLNVMWKSKIYMGSNFNIYYYKVKSTGLTQNLQNDGINYNVSLYGSYKFSKTWGLQAYGNFNGPKYTVQGSSTSFWYYNLSARKEFKNEKGGIAVGLDNFATWYMHFKNNYTGDGFSYDSDNKVFFLGARISFDYRFGKMEFSQKKKKKGIKNDDMKDDNSDQNGGMMNGGK